MPFECYVVCLQVTGKLLKVGDLNVANILALPDITGPARCPHFNYKLVVNEDENQVSTDMVLLLRLYTVTRDTKQLTVIGSCLFKLFDARVRTT